VRAYTERLPALAAEQQLEGVQAASVPHMDKSDRRKIVRDLQKALDDHRPRKASAADLASLGITVEEQPKRV
jgi:hypothetical protein